MGVVLQMSFKIHSHILDRGRIRLDELFDA